ncbi:TonB-dependent receptor [candidate division KSB1 bacterium]|nr:TonB-dependent receptor [candidate division KSB1 bacterium]
MRQNKIRYPLFILLLFLIVVPNYSWAALTGKISGKVFEKYSKEALPGANILLEGTTIGAATDTNGDYFIINVSPGVYTLRAEMMGYAVFIQENVQVNVNQTTNIDFAMKQQTIEGETITVVAERPVVQMDISSSQIIVTEEQIQARPLDNIEEILASEAGITLSASDEGSGLLIRGGELNETDIVIDGLSTRNERNQQPLTNISLTAISEIEILTGGFNAEFGDIRSGMINIVTKDGSLDRYSLNLDARISPPARKHFGPDPFSIEGPFWQVYTGKDAFTGVTDEMVASGKYPFTFVGWNEVARQFLADPDPSNDLTPQDLLEVWKWQHRLREYANKPDYIGDVSFSGKVPFMPVAFMMSERYEDLQLAYPFSRNNSIASTSLLKLTGNISPSMKLSFNNAFILLRGVSGSIYDDTNGMITGTRQGTNYAQNAMFWRYMWHDANYNPIETMQYRGGLTFNHVLSSNTFYDLRLEYTNYKTKQEPIALRDTTGIKKIGDTWYDEAPFGYVGSQIGSIIEKYDILNDFLMSGGGRGQDHSRYWGMSLTGNLVSQINKHNEIKTGFTFEYLQLHERREINHGQTTEPFTVNPGNWWYYDQSPIKLGAYVQDKLEYKGMIANIGVRADYLKPGTVPFNLNHQFIFSELPYTLQNWRNNGDSFSNLTTSGSNYKLYISPRLGISHPVTATSKIFFNYGHFYQPPIMDDLYTIKPLSRGATIPNIGAEWPLTISYEIGFEQSIATDYLIHFMGYYKDVSNQLSSQDIVSLDEENEISTWANNSYADIRGLELKLEKRVGRWFYGWVSMEYFVKSTGYTGLRYIYEDRQKAKQQREITNQERSNPVPSVNANLTFKTPFDFGPDLMGYKVLGDWRLTVWQEWSDGGEQLLNPDALLSEQHYAQVIDWWNTDLQVEKRVQLKNTRFSVFMQVKNLFNRKGFPNPLYWNKYVDSLHFPWETGSQKGNDKLGEWDKDYIDLGWNTWAQFVNPRDIFFGLKFQF